MTASWHRPLPPVLLCLLTLLPAVASVAQEPRGELEIVRATAKKYASIPETPKYKAGRMIPAEGSAFLIVEADVKATVAEGDSYQGEVYIESAKGNRRRAIGMLTSGRGFDDDYIHVGLSREEAKGARLRLVFVVPEATQDASFVVGETRTKLAFPDASVDYPPLGCETAAVTLVSTKLVTEAPKDDQPFSLALETGGEEKEYLAPKPGPTAKKMVALELLFQQANPRGEFDDDEYSLVDGEFVAVFDGGRAISPIERLYQTVRADAVGRLPAVRHTMTIPVPEGAEEGTLYWRQTPITKFKTL